MTHYEDEDLNPGRLDVGLWRRMLGHARPYRRPLLGLSLAGMAVAVCDVFLPRLTGAVIDAAAAGNSDDVLVYVSVYAGLILVMAVMVCVFINFAGSAVTGIAYDLRRDAFSRLQELSFSFYDHRPVGWLMARLTADCDRISSILPWTLLDAVWGTFLLTGISAMMLWMNWRLALFVLLIVPPLSVATAIYQRKLIRTQRLARKTSSRITAAFNEGIAGVRTTKAFVREQENLREFQVLTGEMFGHMLRSAVYSSVYLPVVMTVGATGVGLALWRGGLLTGTSIGVGELAAFMQYAGLFHIPIQEMAERFTGLQGAQASAERLQGLLDTEPAIQDSPDVLARTAAETDSSSAIQEIVFEHVDFAYGGGDTILRDFNLTIRAGESVAFVGETGSGKSTIARLLCRFYEPTGGRILIDGVDYRERGLHWLQSNLGVVLQESHLFSGTVRENIRYGRLDATDEEIEAVADRVGATFIRELANGYETEVGEGGNRLSTGQKQFIALARAMLADPRILVLDEATSSVDTETERRIQSGIETLIAGRVSVIIAHRLSTIRAAGRILVIERGRILEEGNHTELLSRHGAYSRLYAKQFRSSVEAAVISEFGTGQAAGI